MMDKLEWQKNVERRLIIELEPRICISINVYNTSAVWMLMTTAMLECLDLKQKLLQTIKA